VSEQEAIKQVKQFVKKWSNISFQVTESPGPLYTAGVEALASVIREEARSLNSALEALDGRNQDAQS
jgi:hypothetical protein